MAVLLSAATTVFSEVPIIEPHLGGNPTGIAPLYFGPNAFPIPDMLDGRTQANLRVELAGDGFLGRSKDWTADIFARISIPLWTERVNFTLWMPIMEWYSMTPERQVECRLQEPSDQDIRGHEAGDVYISTDIQVLKASEWVPDIAIRAAVKTASGGSFGLARYYDNPGYFFDCAIGKSMYFGQKRKAIGRRKRYFPYADARDSSFELRLSGSAGFLCWQTDNGRQNDAVMYGLQLLLKSEYISLRTTWGGYVGWEKHGDRPMSVKAILSGHIKGFEPYIQYQYGINDYPFHQLRVGLVYNIDILNRNKEGYFL
ncbi:MAG: hypothetical protein MJZ82_04135 [Paludibacteraceae bacterium]|nr:hypothetical protein [Paludibacteraceae bacterium]